jgi:hypothetical protein
MSNYKQPRKLNFVSFPVYATLIVAAYCGVRFAPPYYRNMKVDEILRSAVNEYWAATRGASSEPPQELRDSVERRIRDVGIEDPELALYFERNAELLRVSASYKVVVRHPFVGRATTLTFKPSAVTEVVGKRL